MITIKLQYQASNECKEKLKELQKAYSSLFRSAYKKAKLDWTKKQIRDFLIIERNSKEKIGAHITSCIVDEALQQIESEKELKIEKSIFGGKQNFILRCKGKITNEQWKELRIRPYNSQGTAKYKGNEKFKFHKLNESKIIFVYNRKEKFELTLCKLKKNIKNKLLHIQYLAENCLQPISVKIDQNYVYISYEESEKPKFKSEGNYAGIDCNPNWIGISVFNKEKQLIDTLSFNLKELTKTNNQNKILTESFEIAKKISQFLYSHNVDFFFMEKLGFDNKNNTNKKWFNKLCINNWPYSKFQENLIKWCKSYKISCFQVYAGYSSTIGNIMYDYPDPIASSMEIARRGYEVIIQKFGKERNFPLFDLGYMKSQWKDFSISHNQTNWISLHQTIKNTKMLYRVPWSDDWVFRQFKSKKSKVTICYS